MTLLYFDCISGAAGDMLLGALLGAGAPEDEVRRAVNSLGVDGWTLNVTTADKSGIRAVQVIVDTQDETTSRDHQAIRSILNEANLDPGVRERALATFQILADAEATVHGSDPDHVHFHEVGGVDALVDIVGCAAAIEHFAPERVVVSPLVTGRGWTDSAHGPVPVPAPATLEILRGVPLEQRGDRELITPTGAAILTATADSFGEMPPLHIASIGYGAGQAELDWPNVTRVLVGTPLREEANEGTWLIETNIDDMSPELIPHSIEALMRAGASDAWTTPILMKKGRPAFTLSILVAEREKDRVLDVMYRETTTFGARIKPVHKDHIDREWIEVVVAGETMRVKLGRRAGEVVTVSPEYEDAARVARTTGLPLREIFERATAEASGKLERRS